MKEFWTTIQVVIAGIGGWLGWFLGGCDGLLYALLAFVVIDYITGIMCAVVDKKLSSEVGFKGIFKKVLIFALVGIGHILDTRVIGSGSATGTAGKEAQGMSRTAARSVTVIPPTINPLTHLSKVAIQKRRVAGYARVSTDSDEQFTSYEAQVDYYTQYIKRNPEWEFVKVYTDEGISGTNTKHRIGFNEMIADAMSGKIDLIVTKSVSRFARNTVDSLVTIRKLKEKGVEVYFEKENIYTFDGKGELLLTIMSSLAQEESRSISENVTWGQRKRFADGKVNLPYKQFLGYRKGADGFPEVVPEEAIVVHRIYTRFMEGLTPGAIAKELTADGIPTPSRKQRWQTSTVESILQNEKYKGAALLQKCFTVDFLTKKRKVNEGEVPQYYVEHSHEPIITPEEFDKVQTELARRKRISRQYSGKSIFSSRIVCGDCGSYFGSKV